MHATTHTAKIHPSLHQICSNSQQVNSGKHKTDGEVASQQCNTGAKRQQVLVRGQAHLLSRAGSRSSFLLVAAMTTLRLLVSKPSRWRSSTPSSRRVASCISELLHFQAKHSAEMLDYTLRPAFAALRVLPTIGGGPIVQLSCNQFCQFCHADHACTHACFSQPNEPRTE